MYSSSPCGNTNAHYAAGARRIDLHAGLFPAEPQTDQPDLFGAPSCRPSLQGTTRGLCAVPLGPAAFSRARRPDLWPRRARRRCAHAGRAGAARFVPLGPRAGRPSESLRRSRRPRIATPLGSPQTRSTAHGPDAGPGPVVFRARTGGVPVARGPDIPWLRRSRRPAEPSGPPQHQSESGPRPGRQ
jgi:hypothetical protein